MDRLVHATFRAEREHFWFRGFRRFVRPLVDQAIGPRRDATILDCGCGTGYNLTWLGDYGRAFGIDLASVGVEYARSLGQRRVARASVTAVPFPAAAFDLVTSFDVLYSLADEDERRAVR